MLGRLGYYKAIAFELLIRLGPLATTFFDMVKGVACSRKGHSTLRHSFWAGYWRRAISVGLQRDVAQSAMRIRDKLLDFKHPPMRAHLDLGRM